MILKLRMTMNPAFTSNPKSNASQKAHSNSSPPLCAPQELTKLFSLVR
ncbi:hypothetical protein [Helicobacter marmotae]|nr:hypothetical protein [Helicobacter marmotae]